MALACANFAVLVHNTAALVAFVLAYAAGSVTASAFFSYAWSRLMSSALAALVSPRSIYRGSCIFTFFFGVFWILGNHFEVLEKINYAERLGSLFKATNEAEDQHA